MQWNIQYGHVEVEMENLSLHKLLFFSLQNFLVKINIFFFKYIKLIINYRIYNTYTFLYFFKYHIVIKIFLKLFILYFNYIFYSYLKF